MSIIPLSSHSPAVAAPQAAGSLTHYSPEPILGDRQPPVISEVGIGLALILGILGIRFFGLLFLKQYQTHRMALLLQRMAQLERLLSHAAHSKKSIRR